MPASGDMTRPGSVTLSGGSEALSHERCCSPCRHTKLGLYLGHRYDSDSFSPQVRFVSELITETLTSVICRICCNSWHLRAYWLRNSVPMWETRYQSHLKMWDHWQKLPLTQIHRRKQNITWSEILLTMQYTYSVLSYLCFFTKQEYVYLISSAYWNLPVIFPFWCVNISILENIRVLEGSTECIRFFTTKQVSQCVIHYSNFNENIFLILICLPRYDKSCIK